MITCGLSAFIHPTMSAIPAASLARCRSSPLGRTATSNVALAPSIPTAMSSGSLRRPPVSSLLLPEHPCRPGRARDGLSSRLVLATVRAHSGEGRDGPSSSTASRDRGMNGLSHPCMAFTAPYYMTFQIQGESAREGAGADAMTAQSPPKPGRLGDDPDHLGRVVCGDH
jgi:hypothetical protein